jgi:cell division protein ZapA
MATVTVDINGRPYAVGCADGQEDRVRQLSRQFDRNVRQVAADVGHVGELRLFLMAALILADELAELKAAGGVVPPSERDEAAVARAARAIEDVAERIERLAAEV